MTAANRNLIVLVPALKITGGIKEIVKLAQDAQALGANVHIIAMWRTRDQVFCDNIEVEYISNSSISLKRVIVELPLVMLRLGHRALRSGRTSWLLSHYATYLVVPFVRTPRLWFFVQDLEWTFVPSRLRPLLRRFIATCLARGQVLTANRYLSSELTAQKIKVVSTLPIWASSAFSGSMDVPRDIDVVMIIRRGSHKRVELALDILALSSIRHPQLRIAVITPNDEFIPELPMGRGIITLLRPSIREMRQLYERSKLFLLVSEHEGFGLPPLEAMGSGCVPICSDAGGVRAYMQDELRDNIFSLDLDAAAIIDLVAARLDDEPRLSHQRMAARRIFDHGLQSADARRIHLANSGILDV